MMADAGEYLAWRVSLTLLHVFAISSTIFRLYRRRRFQQLWWDDHVASFCLFLDCLFFSTLWIQERKSRELLIFTTWLLHTVFISLTWCSRISLSLTITRIIPPLQPMRKVNIFLTYLYALSGIVFIIQLGVGCSANANNWMNTEPYQCPLTKTTAAVRTTVDFCADLVLIIVPLVAFWRLKLPLATRRLIQACFCASLLTAATLMLATGMLFSRAKKLDTVSDKEKIAFMANVFCHLAVTVSLLVCNMLIVVTSFYRMFRSEAPAPADVGAVHRAIAAAGIEDTTTERTDTQELRSGATSSYLTGGTYSTEGRSGAYTTVSSIQPLELTQIYESDLSYSCPTNHTTQPQSFNGHIT
ncbi:hypothetical protein CPC08DRAFT_704349 [Agrocybe pediades]|nr:hypothetical protein CPC08DRAFT_704349 [Agrocybe pediades]